MSVFPWPPRFPDQAPSRFQPWAHMWRPPCKSSHCYHSELPKSTDFCPVPASGSSGHHEMCVVNPSTINPKQMPWAILSSPHDRAKCIALARTYWKISEIWKSKSIQKNRGNTKKGLGLHTWKIRREASEKASLWKNPASSSVILCSKLASAPPAVV